MTAFHRAKYSSPPSADQVREDFPGFTFGTFRDPPGQVWADFVHDEDEFIVVAQGEIVITVADETATCGPGDLVRIPAQVNHTLETTEAGGSVWHYGYGRFGETHD
ncbi:cupin domain-containing protein [Roseibium salinum]|uniref:Cupin domain-containing protein n=1 Tax=Roseibium salinum TaxID=1604349 RepID=A0ABT3QVW3_9HYPH|nr:cupin domain-containing protein [Roseibium sp. DSM 29163]MCX2721063.1 cupin domain-containing protein [Roseibium sp. DSM 29163]MDN3722521.1 cupin domain-containing protein [Roseibium salinum]